MIEPGSTLAIIASSVLSLVTGGGAVKWWLDVRRDRREGTTSRVDTVQKLLKMVEETQDRQTETFTFAHRASAEASAAKAEASAARAEVGQVRRLFGSLVRPLVDWIDGGAIPPPPTVPAELRALLEDVEHEHPAAEETRDG